MNLVQIQLLSYVGIGFFFGLGFLFAHSLFNLIGQIITVLYVKYLTKKIKKSLVKDKPKDLHFGGSNDGKII